MTTEPHTSQRETTIDALRGIAVLSMIVAHSIFFFHTQTNTFLNNFELFANTIVLTLFVFVSGASYSKTLDSYAHHTKSARIKRIISYAGITYLSYAIISTVGILTSVGEFTPQVLFPKFIGALTFTAPVNFTEYMTLFIFFPLSGLLFQKIYNALKVSLAYSILAGSVLYLVGIYLYPITFPYPFNGLKELLAGGKELLRFPILFYYPIYLFGLWWEYRIGHTGARKIKHIHIAFVTTAALLSVAGSIVSLWFDIPILSVFVRWPPSIGFLLTGLASSSFLSVLLNIIHPESGIRYIYRYMTYLGRDALDLWMTHLLILFLYKRFIGLQFGDTGTVFFLVIMTILTSTLLSSVRLTNTISLTRFGPVTFPPYHASKFRKRYILFIAIISSFLMFSLTVKPPQSLYGEKLPQQSLSVYDQIPSDSVLTLTSKQTWHVRSGPWEKPIQLSLQINNPVTQKQYSINPSVVRFTSNDLPIPFRLQETKGASLIYNLSPSAIPAGKYFITAVITTPKGSIHSNIIPIINSEPFIVAWTFDWEGWDVSDTTMQQISSLSAQFGNIPFTQFVNPRTFITDAVSQERKDTIRQFLLSRVSNGDEIALHIHMHYDMVEYAGIPVNKTTHWGLLSKEGYDVPTTSYSTDDFRKIVQTGMTILENLGLPKPNGYRAGGWFISNEQLAALKNLGFSYDTSGRDRPQNNAFSSILWRIPVGAQPYYPDPADENKKLSTSAGILEIPNNGVTTYESSPEELLARTKTLYPGGFLTTPTTFVITTHPQFSQTEFSKIPVVLNQLRKLSAVNDGGPVVFGTMGSIYSLWTSTR
jgi:peptidoglycan/xylan/chitin deacetylase (PgdA/CDA1 family)